MTDAKRRQCLLSAALAAVLAGMCGRHQVGLDVPNTAGFFKVTDGEFHESLGFAVIFGYRCPSTLACLAGSCVPGGNTVL